MPRVSGRPSIDVTTRRCHQRRRVADGPGNAAGPLFGVLVGLLALLAWWSSRRMRRVAAANAATGGAAPAAGALARVLPLLPYGTLLVAAVVPIGRGL